MGVGMDQERNTAADGLKTSDYYFDLPKELIAQDPLEDRSASRLLVLDQRTGSIEHKVFRDILQYLTPGDCLVLNDTRVIPARLLGVKEDTGAAVEVLLLKRREKDVWEALVRPGKKLRPGARVTFGDGRLRAEILDVVEEGNRLVQFSYEGIWEEVLDSLGEMPLPPYITHKLLDKNRYQTVYAKYEGSAAAPTAGLHFTKELLAEVDKLNRDEDVDGFIVQLPLPKHISEQKVIEAIDYRKDVDGFHPINVGRMAIGLPCYISATPKGILELLRRYHIETSGRKCVILGRSNIVGKPMAQLMMQKQYGDATVTVCHSHSLNLKKECQEADIIIAAIGQPNFVTADMVKEGATVIDVGTTRVPDATKKSGFRLNGDVKFDEVAPRCAYITPVPGGVGPMTICMLMKNTLSAGKKEFYQ